MNNIITSLYLLLFKNNSKIGDAKDAYSYIYKYACLKHTDIMTVRPRKSLTSNYLLNLNNDVRVWT